MSPEIASFLTLYLAFLCIFGALAFGIWAARVSIEEARAAKRARLHRQRVRRMGALMRGALRG